MITYDGNGRQWIISSIIYFVLQRLFVCLVGQFKKNPIESDNRNLISEFNVE